MVGALLYLGPLVFFFLHLRTALFLVYHRMTLKEYLKVKFVDERASLPLRAKAALLLANLRAFLAAPIPRSDLMC